jgi:hypothetical protein
MSSWAALDVADALGQALVEGGHVAVRDTGPEEAPDSIRKVAIGMPWPCHDSYLTESRALGAVGATGGADG